MWTWHRQPLVLCGQVPLPLRCPVPAARRYPPGAGDGAGVRCSVAPLTVWAPPEPPPAPRPRCLRPTLVSPGPRAHQRLPWLSLLTGLGAAGPAPPRQRPFISSSVGSHHITAAARSSPRPGPALLPRVSLPSPAPPSRLSEAAWAGAVSPSPRGTGAPAAPRPAPHPAQQFWAPQSPQLCSLGRELHVPWCQAPHDALRAVPQQVWGPVLSPSRTQGSGATSPRGTVQEDTGARLLKPPVEGCSCTPCILGGSPKPKARGQDGAGGDVGHSVTAPGQGLSLGRVTRSPAAAGSPPGRGRLPGIDIPANDGGV
ncbi:cilia- and flagella-associated protein 141 isoform X2 [Anser cygnoides]|uniref:cilia- and flagella-associated protein 141 isoform X2 n=1 Tax=Anser cygnoides TaxID=8845 RepID=UPI0034D18AE4